jgi:alkanesulfonate monooxygenase SsuD/methylene tetrahydromethanopterin reductase-like flavin-dependent oxidoreductase (luciferase family)
VKKVAKQGDAWFADPVTPLLVLQDRLGPYKEALRAAGRRFEETEFPIMREAYVAKDPDRARSEGSFVLNNYRDYLKWGHMLDENGRPVDPSNEKTVKEELIDKRFVIGSPDECIAKIERIVKAADPTLLIFRVQFTGLPFDKTTAAIKLFAEKVFPHFNSHK